MASKEKCAICKGSIEHKYVPMKQWKIVGPLCGKCYSKKIFEYYPGDHVKVNFSNKD